MRVIFWLALERARGRIVALALGFLAFELVVGLSFASVDQNAVRQLVEALPPALRALAGGADIATPTGYAGSGYLHPVALALQAAAAISIAAAPAREAEDGTAELVLSRPLRPAAWLAAHFAAMAAGLAVVVAGGYAGGLIASRVVDDLAPVGAGPLALALVASYLCFLAVGAIALLAASLSRTGGRAVGWAAAFVLVSYAIDYLAQVWSVAEPAGPVSVFRYLDPPGVLRDGTVGAGDLIALGVAAAVAAGAAHVLISRRDLTP